MIWIEQNLPFLFSDKDFQPFTEHPDLCNAVYLYNTGAFQPFASEKTGVSPQGFITGGRAGPNMLKKPEPRKTSALNHGTLSAKNIRRNQ